MGLKEVKLIETYQKRETAIMSGGQFHVHIFGHSCRQRPDIHIWFAHCSLIELGTIYVSNAMLEVHCRTDPSFGTRA